MRNINRVCISGNLTREPELRFMGNGTGVLGFGVAVNDSRRNNQTGQWEEYPNFIDCTLFGNRAEGLSKHLHKGTKVFVEGKLRWSQWEKDGQKRSKVEVIVDEIEVTGQQAAPQPQQAPQQYQQPRQVQTAPQAARQPVAQPSAQQGYAQAYQQPYQPQPAQAYQPQQYQQQPAQQPTQQAALYGEDIPF